MSDDLIAAMGRPAGAPKLPNLRTARSAPPTQPPPDEATAAPPASPVVEQPKPARARSTRKGGRPATGRLSVQIGIPVPLVEPMKTDAAQARQSHGDWLMTALGEVWDDLPNVYPPLPTVRPGWPQPRRSPRGEVVGGRQTITFRLTPEQLQIVDDRQAELMVESRSEFVTTVVQLRVQR